MIVRSVMIAATLLIGPASAALADGSVKARHHHVRVVPFAGPPASAFGGRLIAHPSWNIACNKRDAGTRALPCDQPVWVYGQPCEIGLGRGEYINCD